MGSSTRVLKDLRSAHSHFRARPKLSLHSQSILWNWLICKLNTLPYFEYFCQVKSRAKKWFRIIWVLFTRKRGWIMRQGYLGARALSYCYGCDMKAFEKFKLVRFLLLKCHPLRRVDARNADFTA